MIKGTTPTHIYTLPFDTSLVKSVRITYAQSGKVILTKETDKCTLEGNKVVITLTQEETLKFSTEIVQIQVRVLTLGNEALSSHVYRKGIYECLDGEVLK